MTMVSSGPISLGGNATTGGLNQSINIELGQSATATISLNDANVRTLLGKASGTISLNDAYGKANQFSFTISSNQTNANLRTLAVNAGWNQASKVVATIGSGVIITSNSTGTPALTVNGSFPGGIDLINNGTIVGMGGNGGNGQSVLGGAFPGGSAGAGGGTALAVSVGITINNGSGTIAGGGGGGGGGFGTRTFTAGKTVVSYGGAGGGGGGGRTGLTNSSGGFAGTASGNNFNANASDGGSGTFSSAGGGGSGGNAGGGAVGGTGGAGGGWGSSGASSTFAGGGAGAAVTGNSNISWTAFGNRFGGIS